MAWPKNITQHWSDNIQCKQTKGIRQKANARDYDDPDLEWCLVDGLQCPSPSLGLLLPVSQMSTREALITIRQIKGKHTGMPSPPATRFSTPMR